MNEWQPTMFLRMVFRSRDAKFILQQKWHREVRETHRYGNMPIATEEEWRDVPRMHEDDVEE